MPSYLGSSFSYIGPVLAIVSVNGTIDHSRIPLALGGIVASSLLGFRWLALEGWSPF